MNKQAKNILLQCLHVAAIVTGIFMVTALILLLMQQLQLSQAQPLQFAELEKMKEAARSDNQNVELREKIRTLDLLSRRAWFAALAWREGVAKLLFAALALLLGLLWLIRHFTPRIIDPQSLNPPVPSPEYEFRALLLVALISVVAVNSLLFWFNRSAAVMKTQAKTGVANSSVAAVTAAATEIASAPVSDPASAPSSAAATLAVSPALPQFSPVAIETLEKNWPGFRGARNDGRSLQARPVLGWDTEAKKGLLWRAEVPISGFSSPVVFANHLFITGGDEESRALMAYAADSGELLWIHRADGIAGSPAKAPKVSKDTGYAASTAVTDGNLVFAIFATGDLIAVDFAGNRVWARNLGVPDNMYGYSSSLLHHDGHLVIQYDNRDSQTLYCLNTADGSERWRNRRETIISWSSPTLCCSADRDVIVITTCRDAEGFDLRSGEKLWEHAIMGGEVAPSATTDNRGTVFVTNENAVTAAINAVSGELYWKTDAAIMPDVSSPVWVDGLLFIFTSGATVSCLQAETGELLWEKDLKEGFYSSPLLLTDRIIAFDLKGNMIVVKPDAAGLVVEATLPLGEAVLTTPALVGARMWIRTANHLYCLSGEENDQN